MSSLQPSITTQSGLLPVPPGSTSQVSVTDADAYFATTPRDAEWTAIVDKQIWLNEANRWLGQLCFETTKGTCCGMTFDQAWLAANAELALALSKSPTAIIGAPTAAATGTHGAIKSQKLGDLQQDFYDLKDGQAVQTSSRFGPNDAIVLQRFPWIADLLGCFMSLQKTSGTRVIARVRS